MIAREGWAKIAILCFAAIIAFIVNLSISATFCIALAWFLAFFYRIPKRVVPVVAEGTILAPADGKIVSISECEEGVFLKERCLRVSIFMSLFDVHLNWNPCGGIVKGVRHFPGRFLNAATDLAAEENERYLILVDRSGKKPIVFAQVAGLVARRIVCYLKEGDAVERGKQMGLIHLGSRCDVFLPLGTPVSVKLGDRVKGSLTVLAENA